MYLSLPTSSGYERKKVRFWLFLSGPHTGSRPRLAIIYSGHPSGPGGSVVDRLIFGLLSENGQNKKKTTGLIIAYSKYFLPGLVLETRLKTKTNIAILYCITL
jgi:hypothetical protein